MNEALTIENILSSILNEYAQGEILSESLDNTRENYKQELDKIKTGYGLNKKNDKIKAYGGFSIKKNINNNITCGRLYDWDVITHKDKEGKLLKCIADYLLSNDNYTQQLFGYEILRIITSNVTKYFEEEFEEKVEDCKSNYQIYGSFDYMEN
jgi:hypothetical protein